MMLAKCLIQCLIEILPNPRIFSDWWLTMVVIPIITHMLVLYLLVFSLGDAIAGKKIHRSIYRHEPWARVEWQRLGCKCIPLVIKCGLGFDNFVVASLMNLYAKCGELSYARQAFLEVEVDKPQLQAWTALMGGYAQQGKAREAIDLFHKFHSLGLKHSEGIFSSILKVFADIADVEVGTQLHSLIIKMGFNSFILIGNAILDFYMWVGIGFGSLQTGISMHLEGLVCFSLQSF